MITYPVKDEWENRNANECPFFISLNQSAFTSLIICLIHIWIPKNKHKHCNSKNINHERKLTWRLCLWSHQSKNTHINNQLAYHQDHAYDQSPQIHCTLGVKVSISLWPCTYWSNLHNKVVSNDLQFLKYMQSTIGNKQRTLSLE